MYHDHKRTHGEAYKKICKNHY
ncbi:MAG: hypothetical protein PWQ24_1163, partial [Mesotoga sp.]|nr:hypothetical protein [Mesotoga sp.]